jgi:hypothetical protein
MTVIKAYECNFCRSGIEDSSEGRGLMWSADGLQWETIHRAGNHLCNHCAKRLFELFKRTPSLSSDVASSK